MHATQFATAYALATSVGLRAFITLALASLAMYFGYLHPAPAFAWLGSNGATLALLGLAVLEFVSEKIPVVDHFMHVIHFATKPVAAALLVGSLVPEDGSSIAPATYALMGAAALDALGVHAASASVRAVSTTTTLGIANPFVSLVEDALAVAGTVLAFVVPAFAAFGALVVTVAIVLVARRVWCVTSSVRRAAPVPAAPTSGLHS
jgi:hypothetical protein